MSHKVSCIHLMCLNSVSLILKSRLFLVNQQVQVSQFAKLSARLQTVVLSQRKQMSPTKDFQQIVFFTYFLYKAYVIANISTLFICTSTALSFHMAFIFKDVYLKATENTTLKIKEYQNEQLSDTDNPCRSVALFSSLCWFYPHGCKMEATGLMVKQTQQCPETEKPKSSSVFLRATKHFPETLQHASYQISLVRILSFVCAEICIKNESTWGLQSRWRHR